MEVFLLTVGACATTLATGLGALPVSRLGAHAAALRPGLWGLTVGLMTVAAVVGLLLPAFDEGSPAAVAAGLVVGVAFLLISRAALEHRNPHVWGRDGRSVRRSVLVFGVLLVHSLPEGLAIGTAFASEVEGLGLFIILAIGLQNVPEGTSVAIPMEAAGFGGARQFWAAVITSAPQPPAALLAYFLVEQVQSLLPFSFAFAAGAMLTLVAVELVPETVRSGKHATALAGTLLGGATMIALAAGLGV